MTDEHTAAIDFQSRQPKGLDLSQREGDIEAARADCNYALQVVGQKGLNAVAAEKEYVAAVDEYRACLARLRELLAMADEGQR